MNVGKLLGQGDQNSKRLIVQWIQDNVSKIKNMELVNQLLNTCLIHLINGSKNPPEELPYVRALEGMSDLDLSCDSVVDYLYTVIDSVKTESQYDSQLMEFFKDMFNKAKNNIVAVLRFASVLRCFANVRSNDTLHNIGLDIVEQLFADPSSEES